MTKRLTLWCVVAIGALLFSSPAAADVTFSVTLPASEQGAITGRLIVVTSKRATPEPRIALGFAGPPAFGIDVEGLKPGQTVVIDAKSDGYPYGLAQLPADEYEVQALLIRYTQAKRADGHTVWVPFSDSRATAPRFPGNLFSKQVRVRLDPANTSPVALSLTERIPPVPPPADTEWIKQVRITSKILSEFWGLPMTIGAEVLLPKGFAENPSSRYPAIYTFGHFGGSFSFSTNAAGDTPGARAGAADANLETGYQFAQKWMGEGFPRVVGISLVSPGPYFLESYALNSANNGPWGDAIIKELIPYLEKTFRLISEPYGRIVEGASTGGWEALALQLHYPEHFGGAWIFNPDPIDFTRYQLVDIYKDENMFTIRANEWLVRERPFRRTREGQMLVSLREMAALEAVMGSKGRSYYQLDIWQATHGPVGADGYPVLLFDKKTGAINRDVVKYMRDKGYDLSGFARDNWARLGPLLRGKIHMFAGEMDDFYLNLAVYKFQEMVAEVGGKDYPIRFEYGRPKKGHNWHHTDWAGVVREVADYVKKIAPAGAPIAQWNY
jgi:putative esterase